MLLSEGKKTIQKEFPSMSNELIDLVIDLANPNEKFDLIRDPKSFIDNQLSNVSNLQELNSILSKDLAQKDLVKVYNLVLYKFSEDLANLGFESLLNQKVNFF